jgi:calmodulin
MSARKDENGLDKNYHYEQGENIIIEEDENENSNENKSSPNINESNEGIEENENENENKLSSLNEEEEEEEMEEEDKYDEEEEKELTKEEKEKNMEIKEAFNVCDKDCDGFITTDELATVMRTLGHNPTKEELDELIKQYDKDESGTIDLNEFMDLMNNKLKEQQEGQELLETFQIFDKDADGTISADDLKYVIKAVGEELEDYLIEELIEQGDRDHDGKINYHEFVRIMTSK